MSIASIKQAREDKYQRSRFEPAAQSEWVNENYYDLDNILATECDIIFNFDTDTPKELFPLINQPKQDVISLRGVNLPIKIWQLSALRFCGSPILPSDYRSQVIESLRVGSSVAKLTEGRDMFYEKGCAIYRYFQSNEAKRISNDLLNTLLHRSKQIFKRTLETQSTVNLRFSRMELSIYEQGSIHGAATAQLAKEHSKTQAKLSAKLQTLHLDLWLFSVLFIFD
ncbi:hypothetical protein M3Y97_00972900 [Aphelenchoides bicaudatus]|nr:hypothetical protein M3Y97_00972900 [Aphelenchoides bicaudatus]